MFNKVFYCIKTALSNTIANIGLNAAAISTIAITFIIFISFVVIVANIGALKTQLTEQVQIIAYLQNPITPAAVEKTKQAIQSLPEVASVHFVAKDEALRQLRDMLQGQDGILEGLRENPLSSLFEVRLKPHLLTDEQIAATVQKLKKIETIVDIEYGRAWLERFNAIFELVKLCGFLLAGLLFLFSLIVVSNTIKLLMYHRRDEIEIMRLVGATNGFIKLPFCIEGMLQGTLGAGVGLAVLYLIAVALKSPIITALRLLVGNYQVIALNPMSCMIILAAGAALGLAGSLFAVSALEELKT